MKVDILNVALIAPGLTDWTQGRAVLAGLVPFVPAPCVIPPAARLPATERRRVGLSVRIALALADQLFSGEGAADPALTPTVFASSGGDGENCHILCEALEAEQPLLSPTRFTNSVHNAPAGYWSIAAQCRLPSTSLCGYDASFAAGLIEASVYAVTEHSTVALIAYDVSYPEPLNAKRPISSAGGLALMLAPSGQSDRPLATIEFTGYSNGRASPLDDAGLEQLRLGVPSLRGLPLLVQIARQSSARLDIGGNGAQVLPIEVHSAGGHA